MSSSKKWKLKDIFTAKMGCGCGPKSTDVAEPKPKPKPGNQPSSSASSWDFNGGDEKYTSTTTFSPENHDFANCPKIRDSLAIVKESKDPYEDFRQSMLQMILEREIYSRNDLQQLLKCFLQLNSPHHHEMIVKAFMEIMNGGDEEGRVT